MRAVRLTLFRDNVIKDVEVAPASPSKARTGSSALGGPVNLGDVQAFDTSQPVLVVGSVANVRIAGGNLHQPNGRPIQVDGVTRVTMSPGQTSQGGALAAQPNLGTRQQDGIDVTDLLVVGP